MDPNVFIISIQVVLTGLVAILAIKNGIGPPQRFPNLWILTVVLLLLWFVYPFVNLLTTIRWNALLASSIPDFVVVNMVATILLGCLAEFAAGQQDAQTT